MRPRSPSGQRSHGISPSRMRLPVVRTQILIPVSSKKAIKSYRAERLSRVGGAAFAVALTAFGNEGAGAMNLSSHCEAAVAAGQGRCARCINGWRGVLQI